MVARQGVCMGRVLRTIALSAVATAALSVNWTAPASAQTLNDRLAAKAKGNSTERLLVEGREIVYDNDKNTVSAVGNVELNYQGRTLQADRVTYNRATKRVFATGNARLTEADGTVVTGDRFELTDDFKDGFIDSMRLQQQTVENGKPVTGRFSSPRVERSGGETTVFESGTYTACDVCKKDPSRPPLWQVKAARIIHNNTERTIYYEDATLELAGIPVAYIPYFSAPDPTVKRKTGLLAPHYVASSALGYGVAVPYFINLAPNYDVTLTPTFLTRQGFLGQAEFRHRLENGTYNIRAAGIFQQDQSAFLAGPYGAREKDFRGSLETTGRFAINERWNWGWDVAFITDKWFLQNYKIKSESLSGNFFKDSISQVYLTGKSDSGFFDLRSYYFRPLTYLDWQKQQPVVHPVLDYNKRIRNPGAIGGEFAIDMNVTSLSRDVTQFQETPKQISKLLNFTSPTGSLYNVYDTCAVFARSSCLVRGLGGEFNRVSVSASWRRTFIDPIGQTWTPFAFARFDGIFSSPSWTDYANSNASNLIRTGDDDFIGRAMPGIGLEYRYPLIVAADGGWGTHVVEPIAQVIARPNELNARRVPNEDAQSLVFDDTTIFEWNKFSGYDRVEGGMRVNYGAQYTFTADSGAYANVLFGQSYNIAGRNSYADPDMANTGLNSGLETRRSDYVGRIRFAPTKELSFTTRGRFDQKDFALERIEFGGNATFGNLSLSTLYARYAAQPLIGISQRREGLLQTARLQVNDNWYVNGSVLFDMSRYLTARENYAINPVGQRPDTSRWSLASVGLGLGYEDECTTFQVLYTASMNDATQGVRQRDQTVLVRIDLKTLGQAQVSQNLSSSSSRDGISQ